ncbi:MAG: polysaccharide biosynthesis tyrosine autokinase [Chloroflexota bacterium]
MELQRYLTIARRWIWLLVLGVVLGALGGFLATSFQTPIYQASTRFVVLQSANQSGTADYYSVLNSQQLIKTYIQLLTTADLMNTVSEQVGSKVEIKQANASQIQDTQFVLLTVTDSDPERAALIANVLVTNLIKKNEELQAVRYVTSEQNLLSQSEKVQSQITDLQTQITDISTTTVKDQVAQVQAQIDDLQTQISNLQTRISELNTTASLTDVQKTELADKEANLAQLQPILALYQQVYTNLVVLGQPVDGGSSSSSQLSQLQTTLGLYQQIYVSLLSSLENVRLARAQNTPNVVQVEIATTPLDPIRPKPLQSTLLAAAVGLMLAAGIAFLVEYLDDTIKTPEDVERELNLNVLGLVGEMNGKKENGGKSAIGIHVSKFPRSPISESFRSLRTNLEFSGVDQPICTILVTSPGPSEGKTTISSNLAVILAQSGKKVILIDADMRRPSIHHSTKIPNRMGLSDVLRGNKNLADVIQKLPENLKVGVITSGSLPPNPAELLGSEKMKWIIEQLATLADFVVIDSPPSLVADAQILASRVDGVLLVIQPGTTHIDSACATVEQLSRSQSRMLGVILNRIPRNRGYYYGSYYHYSSSGYNKNKKDYSDYGMDETPAELIVDEKKPII